FLGQSSPLAPHSPRLAEAVEAEHRRMLDEAYAYATEVLVKHRPQLEALAGELLREEKVDREDLGRLLGPRLSSSAA
ncbi:MAG TPA: hypothetical protein VFU02_20435, partial [Polyangiaceae bacterium]|nr:hypothetical protein [Polyangiaceae bacterium]